ncbi:hypothetical protein B0H13DRAFT_2426141 [Mycena leptocephala]|nr:hypothetical protein B0H13DRAFT_2426141 [Mycena leptocephala]
MFIASCSSTLFKRLIDCAMCMWNDALLEHTIMQWALRIHAGNAPKHARSTAGGGGERHRVRRDTVRDGPEAEQCAGDASAVGPLVTREPVGVPAAHPTPPKFSCGEGCNKGMGKCAAIWVERWSVTCASRKINAMSLASMLALLGVMHELLAVDQELAKNIPVQCKLAALDAVKIQVKMALNLLWSFVLDSINLLQLDSCIELVSSHEIDPVLKDSDLGLHSTNQWHHWHHRRIPTEVGPKLQVHDTSDCL